MTEPPRPSLLSRLLGWLSPPAGGTETDGEPPAGQASGAPLPSAGAPPALDASEAGPPAEELELERRLSLAPGPGVAPPNVAELLQLVEAVETRGRPRQALELLRRASHRFPGEPFLRLRLAAQLDRRGERGEAAALLVELLEDPRTAPHAHFLLAEQKARESDLAAALEHYELVLAWDFAFPRARARADALRRQQPRPSASADATLIAPEELSELRRFLIEREVGRGGGGTVYAALDRSLGRPVALKVLHPSVANRAHDRAQLFAEARLAAALAHPGVVTIYDLDEANNLVVMEYCAGGTVAALLAEGRVALSVALDWIAQLAETLGPMHRAGIVHRDLKPENLLFRERPRRGAGRILLTDFGIAHAGDSPQETDGAVGSRAYMAPEQWQGEAPDPRTDLYACGVLLAEAVLGRATLDRLRPAPGLGLLEPAALEPALAGVPPHLSPLLLRLLESLLSPEPNDRPPDAAALAGEVEPLRREAARAESAEALMMELERFAGPPPRDEEVERWLARHTEDAAREG
ncbi:MAG: protein kinase [Deltaproteobacteria bacterium]|nr:protein kinase [Deltaproteobacteria bacterium]